MIYCCNSCNPVFPVADPDPEPDSKSEPDSKFKKKKSDFYPDSKSNRSMLPFILEKVKGENCMMSDPS